MTQMTWWNFASTWGTSCFLAASNSSASLAFVY